MRDMPSCCDSDTFSVCMAVTVYMAVVTTISEDTKL